MAQRSPHQRAIGVSNKCPEHPRAECGVRPRAGRGGGGLGPARAVTGGPADVRCRVRRVQLVLRGAEPALQRGLLLRQLGALLVVGGGHGAELQLDGCDLPACAAARGNPKATRQPGLGLYELGVLGSVWSGEVSAPSEPTVVWSAARSWGRMEAVPCKSPLRVS